MAANLTAAGRIYLNMIPPFLRNDPTMVAILEAGGRQLAALEAAVESIKDEIFPQTATRLLAMDELWLDLTVEPAGMTVEQRRQIVFAFMMRIMSSGTGAEWEENMSAYFGGDWRYEEHDPDDPGSPPAFTVNVFIPFAPGSVGAYVGEQLAQAISPANLVINVTYESGFILGESTLGDLL